MERVARRHAVLVSVGLIMLSGLGDLLSGIEITFTLFYLVPIALGTWLGGRMVGTGLAFLATACSTLTSLAGRAGPLHVLPLVWNQVGELGMFLASVWILDELRRYVDRERLERRTAVEQLRHGERLQVIGRLAAGVAHELGTPLSVIAGSAELVEAGDAGATSRELAKVIQEQAARMSAIIRHLLEFGRRGGAPRGSVDLAEVVRGAVGLLAATVRKHGCSIHLALGDKIAIRANRPEIEQVVSNLVLNAAQAMPKGGTIRVETSVETRRDSPTYACITVADAGVGIAEGDLARIFDPFFTTKGVGAGTGLGLSVSYGIVHDHGGHIEVDSVLGRGTRFAILLPLAD